MIITKYDPAPLPSIQDVVRLIDKTVDGTVDRLRTYYLQRPAWSYAPARSAAKPIYSGDLTLKAASDGCLTKGSKLGRVANAEVVKHIWQAAQGREFQCFDLTRRPFSIRRDLSLWVDPLFYFIEQERIRLFWLQPRRGYNPDMTGMALLALAIRMTFESDFDDFDLELLELSVPYGATERAPRILRFEDLPMVPEGELIAALEIFARAYDIVCASGVERPSRTSKEPPEPPRLL